MSLMKMLMVGGFVGTVILVECLAAYMLIPSAEAVAKATSEEHEKHEDDAGKKKDDAHAHGDDAHAEHGDEKHKDDKADEQAKPKKPVKKKEPAHGEKKAAAGHGAPAAGGHGAPAAGGHGAPAAGGHGAAAPAGPPHDPEGEYEVDLGKYALMVHKPAADVMLKVNFQLIGVVLGANEDALKELLAKNQHRMRDRIIFEIRNSEVADLTDPGLGLIKRRILAKSNELLGESLLEEVVFSEFSYNQL